ncbi:hypothetical protein BC833DRAFT_597262 [Globomyces pollinis-pini]|nr:hypothetical protein BC833DRAFT_597262 [Globomyces pollinis-pini]
MKFLLVVAGFLGVFGQGQNNTNTNSTQTSSAPLSGPTIVVGNSNSGGTLLSRQTACTAGSTKLLDQYTACFPKFPQTAANTKEADSAAQAFIQCICASDWAGGSSVQAATSIPLCPPIPGISKGGQAAVAADCAPGQLVSQQRRIILQFPALVTQIGKLSYVPLAGLPPGITSYPY